MAHFPPLNTQPTRSEKEVRKARQQRGTCMSVRGCKLNDRHNGPHIIGVSTARIEGYKAFGVTPIVCPKCGFYGSGKHTSNGVRCKPTGRNAWIWQ